MSTPAFNTATLTAKLLYSNRCNTTSGTGASIYTVPTDRCVKLQTLSLCNTSGGAVVVDVYVIPGPATPGDEHKVVHAFSLPAGDTQNLSTYFAGMMLGEGDLVSVKVSTGSAINAILSGVEGV